MDPYHMKPGAVILVLFAIYFMFIPTLAVAMGLFFIGLVYCYERYELLLRDREEQKLYDTNIVAMQNQVDEIRKNHELILKTSEETKKLLSQANLSRAVGKNSRLS